MWYLKNLLNPRWIFDILKSGSNDLQSLWCKIKAWFWFDQQTLIIFGICFLFKCMAPSEGEGKCIGTYENGIDNVFTLKTSDITSAGGGDIEDGIYKGTGQSMPWIDTGFETTGDQLIVYANGDYFPWGKAATEKTTTYHPITTRLGDTDQWATALQLSEDYQECELNTDIKYTQYDAKSVKELYENHLNKYTTKNPNNRDQGFAHRLTYDTSGIALPNVIQADCINHNNCEIDDNKDENPIGCVLRRGAGIYMKFGEDMPFSYHIINHDVPSLRKECDATGSNCEYTYVKIGSNAIKTTRIPFTLPMMFYRRDELDEDIRDTQEELNGKLVPYSQYDKETDYRFTILEPQTGVCPTGDPAYQTIDSQCYKSVTKKLTKDEVQNYDCKKRDINDEKHPDEFCPPPKGQRIYVKFADTFYEDDEGAVDLIFASGAKNLVPKFKYEINGFKLSWIQYIPYKLIAPFWGDQTKEDKPSELLEYQTYTNRIEIYNKNGDAIYPTTYRGTDFIKTTRFGDRGIRLCGRPIVDDQCSLPSQNLLVATAYKNTDGDISKVSFEPKNSTISLRSIQYDEVEPAIENWLIKIDRLNEGLFFKARDAILVNPFFTFAKIFFALWFVFSFGIGFLNKTKMLAMPTYTKDWKHFLILMWATDPDNYALIDDLLWPALFRYAERFAAGILEIGTGIYGASLHYTNPYEFFDESIQMMTSKQLIYKISSLANDIIYWPVYLGWLPLLGTGIIRYVKTVVSWVWSLVLVLMDLGQIIMLLPFYALISFFKSHEGTLKKTLIRMLHTFTHLAFEMGFFCLLMGFVYKAFLEAIDVDICWRVKFEFKLFWIFPVIKLYAWVIDGINSVFAAYKEIFGGLLLGVLKFFLLSFITDWGSKIAKMAADALMPESMAGSIADAEQQVGKPLGAFANSAMGIMAEVVEIDKKKQFKELAGKIAERFSKHSSEWASNNNMMPRDSGIPDNYNNFLTNPPIQNDYPNIRPQRSGTNKQMPNGLRDMLNNGNAGQLFDNDSKANTVNNSNISEMPNGQNTRELLNGDNIKGPLNGKGVKSSGVSRGGANANPEGLNKLQSKGDKPDIDFSKMAKQDTKIGSKKNTSDVKNTDNDFVSNAMQAVNDGKQVAEKSSGEQGANKNIKQTSSNKQAATGKKATTIHDKQQQVKSNTAESERTRNYVNQDRLRQNNKFVQNGKRQGEDNITTKEGGQNISKTNVKSVEQIQNKTTVTDVKNIEKQTIIHHEEGNITTIDKKAYIDEGSSRNKDKITIGEKVVEKNAKYNTTPTEMAQASENRGVVKNADKTIDVDNNIVQQANQVTKNVPRKNVNHVTQNNADNQTIPQNINTNKNNTANIDDANKVQSTNRTITEAIRRDDNQVQTVEDKNYVEQQVVETNTEQTTQQPELQYTEQTQPITDTANYVNEPQVVQQQPELQYTEQPYTVETPQQPDTVEISQINEITVSQPNVEVQQQQPELQYTEQAQHITDTANYVNEPQVVQQPEESVIDISQMQQEDVSYTYDGNKNEIILSDTMPETQQINDVSADTNTTMDISYSSHSAVEAPIVEKLENKIENKDVAIQKEDAKQDKVQEMIEKYKSEDEEKRIKLNRNVENNAWTKKK